MEENDPPVIGPEHVEEPIKTLRSIGLKKLQLQVDETGMILQDLLGMGLFTLPELQPTLDLIVGCGIETGKLAIANGAPFSIADLETHKTSVLARFLELYMTTPPITDEKASEAVKGMMEMQDIANQVTEQVTEMLTAPDQQVWPKEDDELGG